MTKKTIPFRDIQAGDTIHLLHKNGNFFQNIPVTKVEHRGEWITSKDKIYDTQYCDKAILVKRPLPSQIGAVHGDYVRFSASHWVRKTAKPDYAGKIHTYTNAEVERDVRILSS